MDPNDTNLTIDSKLYKVIRLILSCLIKNNLISTETFSKRNILAILGLIGVASSYAMRSSLSVSITVMVKDIHTTVKDPNACPEQTQNKNTSNPVHIILYIFWYFYSSIY